MRIDQRVVRRIAHSVLDKHSEMSFPVNVKIIAEGMGLTPCGDSAFDIAMNIGKELFKNDDFDEQDLNRFAVEIVMPERSFRPLCKILDNATLAKHYDVPVRDAELRRYDLWGII